MDISIHNELNFKVQEKITNKNLKLEDICKNGLVGNITIGYLEGKVKVRKSSQSLLKEIALQCEEIQKCYELKDVLEIYNIKSCREAYRAFGHDPSKYRVASESLFRRIVKGKGLYEINNIVEINNLISLKTALPVCAYDREKINGNIIFKLGEENELYEGIGRGHINIYNLPCFYDQLGPFGTTTSDSVRAMITESTRELLLCIVSFHETNKMEEYLNYAKELLILEGNGLQITTKVVK